MAPTRKITWGFVVAALLWASMVPALASTVFIHGDIPLMKQLVWQQGRGFVFDKPQGRLVTEEAKGKVPLIKVVRFYQQTLKNLGWRQNTGQKTPPSKGLLFTRGEEIIHITTTSHAKGITHVRFTITPKP